MAGLLAARVLTDHFDRVTILERDWFPAEPGARSGTPQAHHLHLLLAGGYRILERLFPGLDGELESAQAPSFDPGQDALYRFPNGWARRSPTGLTTRLSSRALLEGCLLQRLLANPKVHLREGCRVAGLTSDADRGRVTGVRIDPRSHVPPDCDGALQADLVVDASGRGSRAPEWLQALGYEPPKETRVNSFLGYATRRYRLHSSIRPDWKMLVVFPSPPEGRRGAVLSREEGGTWIVTLGGIGGDYPPTDEEGFLDFARSLETRRLYSAIKQAQPLGPIRGYRRTENRLRHFERLSRWPEGFSLVGDAVCAFNPVYGQGMSVSALDALELDETLRDQRRRHPDGELAGFARRFQKRLAKLIRPPWLLATNEDLRYPKTTGRQPPWTVRLILLYVDKVIEAIPESQEAGRSFLSVIHLASPPATLFRPSLAGYLMARAFLPASRSEAWGAGRMPPWHSD